MSFNDRDYTRDAIIKQLGLIELHCKDGSAVEAGCQCIDTKHLYLIEGLAEEGQGFALSSQERKFYEDLGSFVRLTRKNMEVEDYEFHGIIGEFQRGNAQRKGRPSAFVDNPVPSKRRYLPKGLTSCERKYISVQELLSRCIKRLEPDEKAGKIKSAVAVCRASIKCPP